MLGKQSISIILSISIYVAGCLPADAGETIMLPGGEKLNKVDFERHVMGVVGLIGCNSGACHGSFQGRGSFRLSLFGYDFDMDHDAISEFVDPDDPELSYLLEKATLATDHGGGKRLEEDSWQYRIIHEWIADGATRNPNSGDVDSLTTIPKELWFSKPGEMSQLKVIATFQDGTQENVTPLCKFRVSDNYVVDVTDGGMVRTLHPGDAAIVASYRGHTIAAGALVPAPVDQGFIFPKTDSTSNIDRLVRTKLRQLNVVPSPQADDYEFLRRVTIDTIGRLPAPAEIRAFVSDNNPQKRSKKIDALLDDPLHAALWATKLSDITGNRSDALDEPRNKRSTMWHDWFERRLQRNDSYKEIVRGILTATSRDGQAPEAWVRGARAIDEAALDGFETDYAARDTLDLFWMRRDMDLETLGEQVASALMGIRLGCAKCHKHPYDRWTQVDYRSLAGVFGQVKVGTSSAASAAIEAENQRRQAIEVNNLKLPRLREVFVDLNRSRRFGHPKTRRVLAPKALGGPEFNPGSDTRVAFFDWLTDDENPYFARSFANRVWAHYFGKGIVDPVDDFSIANPPSNGPLLDLLAERFVSSGFDIRDIERGILNSQTYQTSSLPNESNAHDRRNFARSYPRRMMAEVTVDVLNSALGVTDRFPQDAPEGSSAIQVAPTNIRDGNLRFAFQVFGRPRRVEACDCERADEPALAQTLFYMADESVLRKLRDGRLRSILSTDNRFERLQRGRIDHEDIRSIVEEIWLATLSRGPSAAEHRTSLEHVVRSGKGAGAMVDIFWAAINTREFALNH